MLRSFLLDVCTKQKQRCVLVRSRPLLSQGGFYIEGCICLLTKQTILTGRVGELAASSK